MARTQSARSVVGFWVIAVMFLLSVASSAVPSPIYPVYAAEWHLTPLMLTGAFAIYVVGLLASLLLAGSLSDYVGRKPILAAGAIGVVASMVLFSTADGFAMLLLSRAVQGLAIGSLLGTLGAALLDHSLVRWPALAPVLNGAIPPFALTVGAVSSGALVEWGPLPLQFVYVLYAALLLATTAALFVVPERVQRRPGALKSLLPTFTVPTASRSLFRSVLGALISSWALTGLYLSLMPSVLRSSFGIDDEFAAGALIGVFTTAGAVTGLLVQRADARRTMIFGLIGLVVGPALTLVFILAGSLPGTIVGTVVAGVGFGAGFQAALRMLIATAEPAHRAGLLSSMYVACYLAVSIPSVLAGAFAVNVGLTPTIVGYGIFVILAAVVALVVQITSGRASALEQAAEEEIERQRDSADTQTVTVLVPTVTGTLAAVGR